MPIARSIQDLPAHAEATIAPRTVDYLRVSVTDRCNERCLYCLPENFTDWTPRESILKDDELLAIIRAAVSIGFCNFRLTGGEPLVRKGIVDLTRRVVAESGVESVSMTSNATKLAPLAEGLAEAGLRRMNISLDALEASRYQELTRGQLAPVLEGISAALACGIRLKLNTVLMRGKNEDQILPLIHFAAEQDIPIRFIELMPVSLTEMLDDTNFLPAAEVMSMLCQHDEMEPLEGKLGGNGPARYYRLRKLGATVGFIGAMTDLHFCENCNKVRLTADGKLRPCLGNHGEFDLMPSLRPGIQPQGLVQGFQQALREKPPEHLFRDNYIPGRIMTAIGG